ncbi:MAG: AAA family ATPase, partial [Tenacibaculum sp.]|nr:AAA family ATPase [Tenacibaculum sp.]
MIEKNTTFYKEILNNFPYLPTIKQQKLLKELSNFIFDDDNNGLFILKGYAGTGKTTVISTFVNTLYKVGKKAVLLAPTGRAAKVIA